MSEEKKYAIFMPISVQRCAESCGIEDLPIDVAEALAEDASYRVREIVNTCTQFMRHARRNCLTVRDVSKALKLSDIPPTLGEDHADPPQYGYVQEEDFHFLKDEVVNLDDLVLDDVDESEVRFPKIHSNWFLLDGRSCSEDNVSAAPELSSTLLEYFNYVVTCILGEDKELQQESLADLSKNSKIAPLIPYFVNFVSNVNAVSHDLEQLSNLLQTASALTLNPYLSYVGYLKPLASSVLYCVLEPLTASINPVNDHWLLRDYGARLLAHIVKKYHSTNCDVVEYIQESVQNKLSDSTRPLCSHYGAIATINALGAAAVKSMICPNLADYYRASLRIIEEDTNCSNMHLKEDAHKVVGVVMHGLEKLYLTALEDGFDGADEYKICYELLSMFGDSIKARLPLYTRAANTKDQGGGKVTVGQGGSPLSGTYFRPPVKKLAAELLPKRQPSSTSLSEVFRVSKPCRRKTRISIGTRPRVVDSATYSHTTYFNMSIRTSYIGKSRSFHRKYAHNYSNNFLSLTF